MYQNFEGLEWGEDIKNFNFLGVFPNPLGVLNQKKLFPTLIYQFEHIGTPFVLSTKCYMQYIEARPYLIILVLSQFHPDFTQSLSRELYGSFKFEQSM